MKFKNLIIILFLFSCAPGSINKENPNYIPYTAKGFVMIFDEIDYKEKKISVKLNNEEFQIAHNTIKKNSKVLNKQLTQGFEIKYPQFNLHENPLNFLFPVYLKL